MTLLFQGEQGYISPSWYITQDDHVPTWNYVAVEVKGVVKIISNEEDCWKKMKAMVDFFEKQSSLKVISKSDHINLWKLPEIPNEQLLKDIQFGITVFEIEIKSIKSKFKLSQKLESIDFESVVSNLSNSASKKNKELALVMKKMYKK